MLYVIAVYNRYSKENTIIKINANNKLIALIKTLIVFKVINRKEGKLIKTMKEIEELFETSDLVFSKIFAISRTTKNIGE